VQSVLGGKPPFNVFNVIVDGLRADVQLQTDLSIGHSFSEKKTNLKFSVAER
jgi:hypothetical protein